MKRLLCALSFALSAGLALAEAPAPAATTPPAATGRAADGLEPIAAPGGMNCAREDEGKGAGGCCCCCKQGCGRADGHADMGKG